jgi:hypothetical protein
MRFFAVDLEITRARVMTVAPNPTDSVGQIAPMTASDLKKALIAQGFEIYRTLGERIQLADRVRDNLIMDSGVSAVGGAELAVRVVVRAQASDFSDESPEQLFERARALGQGTLTDGFVEKDANVVPIADPGDRSRTLDTWYEVSFQKAVASLEELGTELRLALKLEKTASRGVRA